MTALEVDFEVITATDARSLEALRGDWLRLLERTGESSIDVDPDFFVRASLDAADCSPYVVLFRRSGMPCALVVGRMLTERAPCRIGYYKFSNLRLRALEILIGGLLVSGEESVADAVERHLGSVLESRLADVLIVRHLPTMHLLWPGLASGLRTGSGTAYQVGTQWFATLGQLKHSSKTRATFRRKDRKLVSFFDDQVEVITATIPEHVEPLVLQAASIGMRGYQGALGIGVLDNARWRSRLRGMADDLKLRGYVLLARGEPIAYFVGYAHRSTFQLAATAFDAQYAQLSPGTFLLRRAFEQLEEEGVEVVDFGYGDAAYKQLFGTHKREEATVRVFGRGLRPRLALAVESSVDALAGAVSSGLKRARLFEPARKWWRGQISRQSRPPRAGG